MDVGKRLWDFWKNNWPRIVIVLGAIGAIASIIAVVDLAYNKGWFLSQDPKIINAPIEKIAFFDPTNGEPKVWYSKGGDGRYELYDNRGFHPQTGERLQPITREVVAQLKAGEETRPKTTTPTTTTRTTSTTTPTTSPPDFPAQEANDNSFWQTINTYHLEVLFGGIVVVIGMIIALLYREKLTAQFKKRPEQGEIWKDPETGMEFVFVKGGCYEMGNTFGDDAHDEYPVHDVCVDSFWMGRYEVTQGEWQKVMGNDPAEFQKGDNYPVEQVSWYDVQEFIKKLNKKTGEKFRLPTEAEWEYAARSGGKKERFAGTSDKGSGDNHVVRGGSWNHEPSSVRCAKRYNNSPSRGLNVLGFRLLRTR